MKAKKPNGYVIYRGPSLIDGAPIVVIAVGVNTKSKNEKTGGMLQTYILRADVNPLEANKRGLDFSICGDCPHRGKPTDNPDKKLAEGRTCYVNMGQGVAMVWKALQAGAYPDADTVNDIVALGRGRMVRIGTYGDGAAAPRYLWDALIAEAEGYTAYSHQSGRAVSGFDAKIYMVSADSEKAARAAWDQGARTFRIIADVKEKTEKEILCPASAEAGYRTTCEKCGLCAGASIKAKNIAIVAHGNGAKYFGQNVQ